MNMTARVLQWPQSPDLILTEHLWEGVRTWMCKSAEIMWCNHINVDQNLKGNFQQLVESRAWRTEAVLRAKGGNCVVLVSRFQWSARQVYTSHCDCIAKNVFVLFMFDRGFYFYCSLILYHYINFCHLQCWQFIVYYLLSISQYHHKDNLSKVGWKKKKTWQQQVLSHSWGSVGDAHN